MEKVEKMKRLELLMEEYRKFVIEWNATHSISKAPSFTSWKQSYRETV